jgi:hypothetical protein
MAVVLEKVLCELDAVLLSRAALLALFGHHIHLKEHSWCASE